MTIPIRIPGLFRHTRTTPRMRHNSRQIDVSRVVLVRFLRAPQRSSSDSWTFSLARLRDGVDLLRGVFRAKLSRILRVSGYEGFVVVLPVGVGAEDQHLHQVYAVFDGWGGGKDVGTELGFYFDIYINSHTT